MTNKVTKDIQKALNSFQNIFVIWLKIWRLAHNSSSDSSYYISSPHHCIHITSQHILT